MRFLFIFLIFFTSYQCIPIQKKTEDKLKALRDLMKTHDLSAYIVPSEDEHQSEYVAEYDKRREWISGFTGSSGVAVITQDDARLWTDGRYFIRAEQELDKNFWKLMKEGINATIEEWLTSILKNGDMVGQNAKLTSISDWKKRELKLSDNGIVLTAVNSDLIDEIWTTDRPKKPNSTIIIHDVEFAGRTLEQKVSDIKDRINSTKVDLFVVTALDEVAWLFNLRGEDIPYNPMFFAYAVVLKEDQPRLYIAEERVKSEELKEHLKSVAIRPYESILDDIKEYSNQNKKIWISPHSSYAVLNAVSNKDMLYNEKTSPVRMLKAVKNEKELERSRVCQIRDSAARIRHLHWLENQIKQGNTVTEVSSAEKLKDFQAMGDYFKGLSFSSISAVGAHAADIHFSTSIDTDKEITKNEIYLLDAGAQYLDCSTDITRTHHFGKPKDKEILAYTKVLQGSIDLAKLVFPSIRGRNIDVVARAALWKSGLDYNHGTGHGIGYFLSIHEFPPRTRYTVTDDSDEPFVVGMFQSDEPGYYEEGNFGIRLETDIEVVKANTPYNSERYMTFSPQTLVPFDKNLIDVDLLEKDQIAWLNDYNKKIRQHVGDYFKSKNEKELYDYLISKTEPFSQEFLPSGSFKRSQDLFLVVLTTLIALLIKNIHN